MTRAQFIGLFFSLWGFYSLTASGHIHTIDSYQVYQVARSLVERGDPTIPQTQMAIAGDDGRIYSKFGPGQSVLAAPLLGLARLLYAAVPDQVVDGMIRGQGRLRSRVGELNAEPQFLNAWPWDRVDRFCAPLVTLLFNPAAMALCITLLAALACQLGYSPMSALALAAAAGLGTFAWPLARDFFQHPLVTALLLWSLLIWLRQGGHPGRGAALFMGILGGIALLTRPFTATWVPVLGGALAYDLLRRRASPRFMAATLGAYLLPLLGAGLVQLLFNQLRFGAPFSSGYHTAVDGGGFTTPLLEGLRSNLISPERSLFIFAPPLLAALAGVPVFARRHRRLALVIAALTAIYMVGYSKWWAYAGGWCIGPRFLLPAALLLLLPGLALFHDGDGRRWAGLLFFGLTTLVGICWQVALISIEYTSLYTMHQGMQYPILDTVRALSQTRWWELNFFYLNMFGQLPRCWYFLLLALPLSLLAAGAYLGLAHGAVMARMERTKA